MTRCPFEPILIQWKKEIFRRQSSADREPQGALEAGFKFCPKNPQESALATWAIDLIMFWDFLLEWTATGMNSNQNDIFLELKQTQKTGKVHHMNRLYCRITCHFGICSLKCTFLKRFSFPAIFSRLSNTAKASVDMQNARIRHHYTCISACLHLFHK